MHFQLQLQLHILQDKRSHEYVTGQFIFCLGSGQCLWWSNSQPFPLFSQQFCQFSNFVYLFILISTINVEQTAETNRSIKKSAHCITLPLVVAQVQFHSCIYFPSAFPAVCRSGSRLRRSLQTSLSPATDSSSSSDVPKLTVRYNFSSGVSE